MFCEPYINNSRCSDNSKPPLLFPHRSSEFTMRHILPQLVLAFIAIIMNSVEMYLMKKRKKYFPSEYLMISLALADLLFSFLVFVGFILTIVYDCYFPLYNPALMSEVMDTLISFSIFASIVHVVAISLDRLFAVLLPLRHRVAVSAQRMRRVVVLLWCSTVLMIGPITVYRYHQGIQKDIEYYTYRNSSKVVSIVMFTSAVVVAIIYATLTRQLAIQARFLSSIKRTQKNSLQKTKICSRVETVALFTAIIVTVAFLLCTLPYATLMVVDRFNNDNVETLCVCMLICNSILNPIVYFWRGYWLKSRRTKSTVGSGVTEVSKTKEEPSPIAITTLTRSAALACIPVRDGVLPQSGKYDLDITLMDIFDFDSISRFRKIDPSFYRQNQRRESLKILQGE